MILQYGTKLANRFSTIEHLVAEDEKELIHLGIVNETDRVCIIKQAQLFCDKVNKF